MERSQAIFSAVQKCVNIENTTLWLLICADFPRKYKIKEPRDINRAERKKKNNFSEQLPHKVQSSH